MIIDDKTFTKEEQAIADFLLESNAIEEVYDGKSCEMALKAWRYLINWGELSKQNILRVHAILMKGKLDYDQVGAWRNCAVWIGGHEAKPFYAVPTLIEEWIKTANLMVKYPSSTRVEEDIKQHHVRFEAIHPFVDGNGRVGRIILNWMRIKSKLPILVIKEAEKMAYYAWFGCACMSDGHQKNLSFKYHSQYECSNNEVGLLKI